MSFCHEFSDLCLTLQNILGYLARPPPPPLLQKCNHPPASLLFLLQSILCQASASPLSLRRACLHHLRLLLWNFSPARLNSTILNWEYIEIHFYWLLIEYPRPQMDSTTSKTNLWLIRAFALSAASWYQGNHHFIIAMIWLPVKSQVPGQQAQCALKYKKTSALAIDFPVLANAADTDFACLSPAPVALGPEVQLTVSCFFLFQKQCKRSHIYCLCLFVLQWQSTSSISKAVRSANFYCRHRHFWFKCYWIRLLKKKLRQTDMIFAKSFTQADIRQYENLGKSHCSCTFITFQCHLCQKQLLQLLQKYVWNYTKKCSP